jgi:hypothetical protein
MFKCLCDTIILDDFKTALDTLSARWMMRQGMQGVHSVGKCSLLGFLALFRNLLGLSSDKWALADFTSHSTFHEERHLPSICDNLPLKLSASAVHIE